MKINSCISCDEGLPENDCPNSKRECGHHCNHSWLNDHCCWCGKDFGEGGETKTEEVKSK